MKTENYDFDDHKIDSVKKEGFTQPYQNDTTNQYIYDFMYMVIIEQKLDLHCRLSLSPVDGLSDLMSVEAKQHITSGIEFDEKNGLYVTNRTTRFEYFTKADKAYMSLQNKKLESFMWDPVRLGFHSENQEGYYRISVPLFSIDKNKAYIYVGYFNPAYPFGRDSRELIFEKINGKWTSKDIDYSYY